MNIRKYIRESYLLSATHFWVDPDKNITEVPHQLTHMAYIHSIHPELSPSIKDLPLALNKGWVRGYVMIDDGLCEIDISRKFKAELPEIKNNVEAFFGFEGHFDVEFH